MEKHWDSISYRNGSAGRLPRWSSSDGGADSVVDRAVSVATPPVRASAFLHFILNSAERYNRSFTSVQPASFGAAAETACDILGTFVVWRHWGGLCVYKAVHDGFIFFSSLDLFSFPL